MKHYLTIVWSMAALAIFPSRVLGSPQSNLRGSNTHENNGVAARSHHRVLERLPGGRPSVVEGMLGELGVDPKKASTK
jgi:hypothetical protein